MNRLSIDGNRIIQIVGIKVAVAFLDENKRIDTLQKRIDEASHKETERTKVRATEADGNYKLGNRVLADLIGGIGGGALIGWVIDRLAGTEPWALLVFLFLGIVVAFRNVFKIASGGPDKKEP